MNQDPKLNNYYKWMKRNGFTPPPDREIPPTLIPHSSNDILHSCKDYLIYYSGIKFFVEDTVNVIGYN